MYVARANQQKTIEELMEELKVGEYVALLSCFVLPGLFLMK